MNDDGMKNVVGAGGGKAGGDEHPLDALIRQVSGEEKKKAMNRQKALRTFEGDIAEAVSDRNASMASMRLAEEQRTAQAKKAEAVMIPDAPASGGKKFALIIGSVILVVSGLYGAYYLYLKSPLAITSAPAAPQKTSLPSLVPADSQKLVNISGLSTGGVRSAIVNALAADTGAPGTINQLIPVTESSTTGATIESGFNFLVSAGISDPDILSRSLNPEFMLGTYIEGDGSASPFMVLSENFFQNAYAGMISWENTMPDGLAVIFPSIQTGANEAAATSGPPAAYFDIAGTWSDGVIDNKNVRLFSSTAGKILFLYSFVDNNTIAITTSENALAAIIGRLENQTYSR